MQVVSVRGDFFRDIERLESKFTETISEAVQTLLSEFHDAPGGYQGPKLDDDLVILLQEKETLLRVSLVHWVMDSGDTKLLFQFY